MVPQNITRGSPCHKHLSAYRNKAKLLWPWFLLQELILSARSTGEKPHRMKHPPDHAAGEGRAVGQTEERVFGIRKRVLSNKVIYSDWLSQNQLNLAQWGTVQEEFLIQHQVSHFPAIFSLCWSWRRAGWFTVCRNTPQVIWQLCPVQSNTTLWDWHWTHSGAMKWHWLSFWSTEFLPLGILTSVWSWGSAQSTSALCSMMWSRYSMRQSMGTVPMLCSLVFQHHLNFKFSFSFKVLTHWALT